MIPEILSKAKELGFIGVGFSLPLRPFFLEEFKSWVASGRNAEMAWMERNTDIREDPSRLLSGCRSIISLAFPYPLKKPSTEDGLTLSRYSRPTEGNYHSQLREKCLPIADLIKKQYRSSVSRVCVDSAPILERSFAYSSGIGYIGKNNMLIIPGYGSYFYLAEILTTAPLDIPAIKPVKNICGKCDNCIRACPTGALMGPNDFDSSKCLSYLTIEFKGDINEKIGEQMDRCFFGCDICQEVCPHNKENNQIEICMPPSEELLSMDEKVFKRIYGKTALSRAGLAKIKSNLSALAG
ncbi:tRNA epoxyqueuosine(34) reductase QueG [Thermodesulfobacteriota bacterium]